MPYNSRSSSSGGTSAWQLPHSRNLALLVLVALVVLWALRHIFGSVKVEGGIN